ncbi:zinc finger protein 658B-like [Haliotis rubra]|uniref:zinc finger protein 658B-like n=1 Tax=Haliotis rubra TaxID=36100 RepID=UPI001EE4F0AE|nr:zinc finger protein 658B-like [Haliotis rubra]
MIRPSLIQQNMLPESSIKKDMIKLSQALEDVLLLCQTLYGMKVPSIILAGYEKQLSDTKGYDSMLDLTGYDSVVKDTNGIADTNQASNGNVASIPHNKGYDMLDNTGYDNVVNDTNGIADTNQASNGNVVSIPHNKGYDMLDNTGYDNVVKGASQTVDINQDSGGYVLNIPDNKSYVNHDAELLITWNSDQSTGVNMDSMSSGRFDSDGIRFSDDALSFDVCSPDFKPVQACTFENVFEKFVSDRSSNHGVDSDECTDTIFVCKYCREWFVTDPHLKNHLLQHCDNSCLSSAGRLTDSSFNSTGMEHFHSHLNIIGKSHVDSDLSMIGSLDTNVDPFQSSQFEEFWIHDSSTLDLTEQSEHPAQENPTETQQVEPVDLDTHLNTVEQSIDGHSQLKSDQISYLDSLGNIKITCHQCSKAFHEDDLFCHDPCFTNKDKDLDECGVCHRKFSSYKSVLTHMRAHSELANQCAQYPRTYQSKGVVDAHCEVHTLEHKECHICGKLVNPAQLKYHVKLHDRDVGQQRSLQCVVCEQSLPDMTSLASHQYSEHSMHDDSITDIISCYKCPHCKEEMQHKPLFIAHVASHTGVFPFECSLCLEGFFYKTLLNVHSNKYHSVP